MPQAWTEDEWFLSDRDLLLRLGADDTWKLLELVDLNLARDMA